MPEQTRQSYGDIPALPDAMQVGAAMSASQNGARAALLDGEDPPFDVEAT
jgi:hypothetical protein